MASKRVTLKWRVNTRTGAHEAGLFVVVLHRDGEYFCAGIGIPVDLTVARGTDWQFFAHGTLSDAKRACETLAARILGAKMSKAGKDVLAERERQKKVEGWTAEHDDDHEDNQLAIAAASYAAWGEKDDPPLIWPWDRKWWKPTNHRRSCVKAAALLIAEIERLDRLEKGTHAKR